MTDAEVQLAVDGERARLLGCYRHGGRSFRRLPDLSAQLVIASTGGVARVTLDPATRRLGRVGSCVEDVLRSQRFRAHPVPTFAATVRLPPPREAPPASPPPSPPTRPKPLTGDEIQATVHGRYDAILHCLQTLKGSTVPSKVDASLTIDVSGRVSQIDFEPALPQDNGSVDKCLRRVLGGMRFRRHPAKGFRVTIPLKLRVL
jgi:hypothetical protein